MKRHGHAGKGGTDWKRTPEYRAWRNMINRCEGPYWNWAAYGGRGIRVAQEWRHDFAAFLACVGERPSYRHSLDRIDVNGDYAPGNVRWATRQQQAANKRPRKNWKYRRSLAA